MRISNILLGAIILSAGCSSPKSQVQIAPSPQQVQIAPSQQQVIYVDGEVRRPGPYQWKNGMTLQDAINAGELTDFAIVPSKLRIVHPDGSTQIYRLNSRGRLDKNPPIQPGDKIYILRPYF